MAGGGVHIGTVYVKVEPDTKGFKKKVQDDLTDVDPTIKPDADTKEAEAKIDRAARDRKTKIEAKVDVDQSAWDRFQKALGKFRSGDAEGVGGGKAGLGGMGAFLDTAALVAAVAAIAAPVTAIITGLLATIPAVIGAIAVPFAAIMLGLEGIGKAAAVLQEPLTHLKETMSKAFEDKLTPVFQDLTRIFPQLEAALPQVATSLADVAQGVVNAFTSDKGLAGIAGIITNVSNTISKMAPGIEKLTGGFIGLAEGVTGKFPAVATWLDTVGTSFQKWVDHAAKSGELNTAMDNLGGTLKGIADIGGDILAQGFEWLSDPVFMGNVKTFVSDIQALGQVTMPALGDFFTDLSGAIHDVRGFIDWLPAWMKPDAKPPEFAPGMKGQGPHGEAVKSVGGLVDETKKPDPSWWDDFLSPITSPNAPWRKILSGDTDLLGGGLTGKVLGQQIDDALSAHGEGTLPIGPDPNKVFEPSIWEQAWNKAKAVLGPISVGELLGGGATGVASADVGEATAIGTRLGEQIKAGVQQSVSTIDLSATVGQIGASLGASVGGAGAFDGIQNSARTAFAGLGGIAQQGMGAMAAAVANGANQATAAMAACSANITAALIQAASGAEAQGSAIGAGLARGIASSTGAAVAAAAAMVGSVNAVMAGIIKPGSPSKLTTYYGETLGQGLELGIDKSAAGPISAVKELMQAVKDVFGDASGLTINFNMGAAASSFGSIAESSKTIGDNLSNVPLLGSAGPTAEGATFTSENQDMLDRLSNEKKLLDLEIKRLQIKKEEGGLSEEEKARYDALKLQRDKIGLQKDELSYQKGIAKETGNTEEQYNDLLKKITESAVGVVKQPFDTAMSDLGIGGGAITAALDQGISWATSAVPQMIFNTSNVEDTIAIKNNQINKQKQQYASRGTI